MPIGHWHRRKRRGRGENLKPETGERKTSAIALGERGKSNV